MQAFYTEPSTQQPGAASDVTADDGLVWVFAVQPGTVSVSGSLADGLPVQTREVHVEADLVIQVGLEP